MRIIDADALKHTMIETLEALLKNPKMDNQEAHLLAAFHTVGKMIDDAPTVEPIKVGDVCKECWRDGGNVVEVVRCKDCRHWDDVPIADERRGHECHLIDGNKYKIRIATPSDWFCPAGEKRIE